MSITRLVGWLSVLALLSPCFAAGCSGTNPEESEESQQSGRLEFAVVSSANGHSYRLAGAYLYVTGPTYSYLDLTGDTPVVSLPLLTGSYTAFLYNPMLLRDDGTGNFVPVEARLASSSVVSFQIYDGAKTTIAFAFETDGVIVQVGSGTLDVRVDVTEKPAICTPFGSECGQGAWCPPSGLTGLSRACVAAGSRGAGEPCQGPLDCAADSSCFDFGSGPVCADLCEVSEFGSACAADSECIPAGVDYGICTPTNSGAGGAGGAGGGDTE